MTNEFPLPSESQEEQDSIEVIQETLDKFLDSASVYAVYGEPIEHGDTAIIPTAEVLNFMGFGIGSGAGPKDEQGEVQGIGGGGGGGGRILSRPVAVIVASPQGVRVEPVVDVTKVALAALTAAGFMLGMLLRMRPSKRNLQSFDDI